MEKLQKRVNDSVESFHAILEEASEDEKDKLADVLVGFRTVAKSIASLELRRMEMDKKEQLDLDMTISLIFMSWLSDALPNIKVLLDVALRAEINISRDFLNRSDLH